VSPLKERFKKADIYLVTKEEFATFASLHPDLKGVISFNGKMGFIGIIKLSLRIRRENFDLIYDAHSNVRSFFLRLITRPFSRVKIIKRSKERFKRILLFWFRINRFPKPFRGIKSFLNPLVNLGISQEPKILKIKNFIDIKKWVPFEKFILLAPSAAWELKRWPLHYWKNLIGLLPEENFVVLGGKEDNFCQDLEDLCHKRVINLAGKISYDESTQIIAKANLIISGDTGAIHIADLLGVKGILLIGPTAFGFTTGPHISILERPLECRPCTKDGRGKCSNVEYKKCLMDINPSDVAYLVSSLATSKS
jgi:heptosyltransferase-2